jgi:hypothetical protein
MSLRDSAVVGILVMATTTIVVAVAIVIITIVAARADRWSGGWPLELVWLLVLRALLRLGR